jgi:hypothetical protein
MPDDAQIVIDTELPRPASGTNLIKLTPGKHVLSLRRPHFEDSPPVQVNLKPGQTQQLDSSRFPQERQGAFVFKIQPAAAVITYYLDQPNQTPQPHKAIPGETSWVKPGRYSIKAEAPGFVSETWEYSANPGVSLEIKRVLKAMIAEPTPTPTVPAKKELFEDPKSWSRSGNWWVWKSSSYAWLNPKHGIFAVTIQRQRKGFRGSKKVEWTIDNHENGDGIDYYIEDNTLHRDVYKNGTAVSKDKIEFAKHPKDYVLTLDVSPQRIIISEAGNGKVDQYDRTNPGAALGKIGFKGEISITVQQK